MVYKRHRGVGGLNRFFAYGDIISKTTLKKEVLVVYSMLCLITSIRAVNQMASLRNWLIILPSTWRLILCDAVA